MATQTHTASAICGCCVITRTRSTTAKGFTTNAALSQAHIDNFKSPAELVENQDVVIWYAAHFLHDESHAGGPPHIVGPDIRPVKW
jgi:hypothetical protein